MRIFQASIFVFFSLALSANAAGVDQKSRCTVISVDKTPVYFLGPQGHFPAVDSVIELDLTGDTISEDLLFEPIGHIPLKTVNTVIKRRHQFSHPGGDGITYFDGTYTSPSRAVYTLAFHVAGDGTGQLQIARRAFLPKLELYSANLRCEKI